MKATNRIPDLDGLKKMFDNLNVLARSTIVEKLSEKSLPKKIKMNHGNFWMWTFGN